MKTLDQVISDLPADERAEISQRAKQLIAEEHARRARKAGAQKKRQDPSDKKGD